MYKENSMESTRRENSTCSGTSQHAPIDAIQGLLDNHENFDKSRGLSRILFFTKVAQESSRWNDFPPEMVEIFGRAFVSKSSMMGLDIDGGTVVVDFHRMLLIKETGCGRSIAWIDVEGKCFFPKDPMHCCCCWDEGIGRVARQLDRPLRRPPQIPDLNLRSQEAIDDENNEDR